MHVTFLLSIWPYLYSARALIGAHQVGLHEVDSARCENGSVHLRTVPTAENLTDFYLACRCRSSLRGEGSEL